MKKHNKLLTLFLALALFLMSALPMTALAAGETGSITITPPANHTMANTDFKAFRLFDVTVGAAPNYSYAYTAVPGVAQFLTKPGMSKYGADAAAFLVWLQGTRTEAEIIQLAKDLAKYKDLFTPALTADQATTNVKFNNVPYGYYLVTGAAVRNGQKVYSRGMLVLVPAPTYTGDKITGYRPNVEIKLKADSPAIDKEVWNHNKGTNPKDDAGWTDWTDVNIGDTVYFKHVSKVPDMTGYTKYTYIVHDTMSKGLTFVTDPAKMVIKMKKDGQVYIVPTDQYTVRTSPATDTTGQYVGGLKIDIEFKNFLQYADKAGWEIEIVYEAVLNEHAIIGAPGNPNKVYLEYSNNPDDENETGKTPEDEVIVYTFDMEIYKYTGELPGTPLAGAEFELSPKAGSGYGEPIKFIKLENDANYDYRVAKPGEQGATTTLVSNASGKIRIKGLDAGEYGLKETKAPEGYNMIPGWITTVIIHKPDANGQFKGDHATVVNGKETQSVNVQNNAGGELPGTGGIGIYIFFAVGGAMMSLLCAAFVIYKKRKTLGALDVM